MKTICTADEAAALVQTGDVLLVGGFGFAGTPLSLIEALVRREDVGDLTLVSNNGGQWSGQGLGKLILQKKVKKLIGTFFTNNPDIARLYSAGELEVQLVPQGTFAEGLRAAGAGIPAFYTRTAVGTPLAQGKETRIFDGDEYLLERAIHGDVAFIKAHKADRLGNLVYRRTGRNFNALMATAAETVIAEVDEIVEVGELRPEEIITPHLYVDRLVLREVVPDDQSH
mgnify:CR=1 FL=1